MFVRNICFRLTFSRLGRRQPRNSSWKSLHLWDLERWEHHAPKEVPGTLCPKKNLHPNSWHKKTRKVFWGKKTYNTQKPVSFHNTSFCKKNTDRTIFWLVVEPTHLKNMLVKLDHFPNFRDEHKKSFETTNQFSFLILPSRWLVCFLPSLFANRRHRCRESQAQSPRTGHAWRHCRHWRQRRQRRHRRHRRHWHRRGWHLWPFLAHFHQAMPHLRSFWLVFSWWKGHFEKKKGGGSLDEWHQLMILIFVLVRLKKGGH